MKVDDKLLKRSLNAAIDFSVMKKEGFKDKVRKFDETIDFIINLFDFIDIVLNCLRSSNFTPGTI